MSEADNREDAIQAPGLVPRMRLRAEPPRVTRLSCKVLAGLGLVASLGIGGALIYALQTRDRGNGGVNGGVKTGHLAAQKSATLARA